jgi:hypothetical protein
MFHLGCKLVIVPGIIAVEAPIPTRNIYFAAWGPICSYRRAALEKKPQNMMVLEGSQPLFSSFFGILRPRTSGIVRF